MSTITQPRSPLAYLLLLITLACVSLIIGVYLVAPPGQESVVAENVGYAIGTIMVMGWYFVAIHSLVSLVVGWIFALCYYAISLFSRLRA